MKSTIRRLLFVIMVIAMVMQAHAFVVGDHFSVKNDPYKLDYQVTNATSGNFCVVVNSTPQTSGEIVIPAEVTDSVNNKFKVVGVSRFGGSNVTHVTISEGVTNVESSCFSLCLKLTTISLPASLTKIADKAFVDCPKLENIILADGNTSFVVQDGALYDKDVTTLLFYPATKTNIVLEIPSTVTRLGGGCISQNPYLEKIVLPEGLASPFDPIAVQECEKLTAYEISKNATNFS